MAMVKDSDYLALCSSTVSAKVFPVQCCVCVCVGGMQNTSLVTGTLLGTFWAPSVSSAHTSEQLHTGAVSIAMYTRQLGLTALHHCWTAVAVYSEML